MNNAAKRDRVSEAEELLLLPSYGRWSREGNAKSYPAWVIMMIRRGEPDNHSEYFPPITDDYALWLDKTIAGLHEQTKEVMYCMYVLRMSRNAIAQHQRRSPASVAQDRDWALAYLCGQLK